MFREMRRNGQLLPVEETESILRAGTSGVLALLGDDDYPYAVPVSYVYAPPCIYFHSALTGHKVDSIRKHGKASFCVIAQDDVQSAAFTTCYRSVIAFGKIRVVEDAAEKRGAMEKIARQYSSAHMEGAKRYIDASIEKLHVIALEIEHLTGKESKALAAKRSKPAE